MPNFHAVGDDKKSQAGPLDVPLNVLAVAVIILLISLTLWGIVAVLQQIGSLVS